MAKGQEMGIVCVKNYEELHEELAEDERHRQEHQAKLNDDWNERRKQHAQGVVAQKKKLEGELIAKKAILDGLLDMQSANNAARVANYKAKASEKLYPKKKAKAPTRFAA
jgi:hypothetical protein